MGLGGSLARGKGRGRGGGQSEVMKGQGWKFVFLGKSRKAREVDSIAFLCLKTAVNYFVTCKCKATRWMIPAVIHNFKALRKCNLGFGEGDDVKGKRPTSYGINLP